MSYAFMCTVQSMLLTGKWTYWIKVSKAKKSRECYTNYEYTAYGSVQTQGWVRTGILLQW